LADAAQIVNTSGMPESDDIWIPLVDEPIGSIVTEIQHEHPDIDALIATPHRLLAFRTFAYVRVGLLLGQLLFDADLPPYDGSETWVDALIATPHRLLAFRTFAYVRVGVLLGQLLFDADLPPYDGSETWVDALLRDPEHHDALTREVRRVAEEIAADPKYADDEQLGPDEEARTRFREFARKQLGSA